MKKTLIIMALTLLGALSASAQEVAAYDATDSTAYYNALYNPNDYAQAPVRGPQRKVFDRSRLHANVNMGVGMSGGGSCEYVNPTFNYDLSKKWSLNFGMGVAYSTFKFKALPLGEDVATYQNLRAISNYYSVGAEYRASDRLSLYGDLIYARTSPLGGGYFDSYDKDRYMANFGATFNISKSFSVGFEVSTSRGVNPYMYFDNPKWPF